jgi:hypothetical protein
VNEQGGQRAATSAALAVDQDDVDFDELTTSEKAPRTKIRIAIVVAVILLIAFAVNMLLGIQQGGGEVGREDDRIDCQLAGAQIVCRG